MRGKRVFSIVAAIILIGMGIPFIHSGFKKPEYSWYESEKKIRDVFYLSDGKVMVSNAAPFFGKVEGDGNPYVLVYDFSRGKVLWEMAVDPLVPVVYDGKRIVIVDEESIFAVNANSGAIVWKQPFSADLFSQIAVDEDIVVVSADSMLYAFATGDGELLWTADLPNRLNETLQMILWFDAAREESGIQVLDGQVFLRTYEAGMPMCQISMDALSKQNGKLLWHWNFEQVGIAGESTPCLPIDPVFIAGPLVFQPSHNKIDGDWICVNWVLDIESGEVLDSFSDQEYCFSKYFVSSDDDMLTLFNGKKMLSYDVAEGKVLAVMGSGIEGVIAGSLDENVVLKLSETDYQMRNLLNNEIEDIFIDMPLACGEDSELVGMDEEYLIFKAGDCLVGHRID